MKKPGWAYSMTFVADDDRSGSVTVRCRHRNVTQLEGGPTTIDHNAVFRCKQGDVMGSVAKHMRETADSIESGYQWARSQLPKTQ